MGTQPEILDALSSLSLSIESHPEALRGEALAKVAPVEHRLEHGHYMRICHAPAGMLAVTAKHLADHAFFFAEGAARVIDEHGASQVWDAPRYGITPAGTQRIVLMLSDTTMVTVHALSEELQQQIELGFVGVDQLEGLLFDFGVEDVSDEEVDLLVTETVLGIPS